MAEELIYKVGVEGTNELDKLEKSVDKAGKSTGKTKLYMSELRTELRKARGDMIKYAEGTEEYNRALEKGARITQQINDANSKMRLSVQDLGTTTKNVTGALTGFAGGFQVVQSTMSLFGIENEETIKTVLKLQQTMSIVQGMSAFAQGIGDAQDILYAFRQSNNQAVGELQDTSNALNDVSKSSDNMVDSFKVSGKESAVLSSNLAGATNAADETSKGMNNLMTSLSESGGFFDRYKEAVAKANVAMLENDLAILKSGEDYESFNNITNRVIHSNGGHEASIESVIVAMEKEIALNKSTIEGLNQKTESLEKTTKATDNLSKGAKESGKAVSSFAKTIGKSLLTMGAFLAVIWAVTEAISWMIKKLSEVPEDLKITLEIEDTAIRNLTKDIERARLFALRYNKAVSDGNKERIKQLEEIGRKDFKLNDAQLKAIGEQREAWKEAFKEYLQIAKDTYYNEALAKRKSEAEVNLQIAEQEEASYRLRIKEQDLNRFVLKVGAERISLDRKLNKSLKEQKKIKEEIAVLDKIDYKDIPSPKVDSPTTDPSGGVSAGKAPSLQDKRPDAVEDDASIQLLRSRNALTRELSNEEMVIYEENQRFKDQYQSDSELRYTEYQIRLAQARAIDLENQREYLEETLSKTEQYYAEELESTNEKLEKTNNIHNEELAKLREYNQKKFDIEGQAQALLEERQGLDGKKDAAKIKAIDDEIEALNRLYKANNDNISQSKDTIAGYKEEKAELEEKLKTLDTAPEEIARMKDAIIDLNLAIADNSKLLVQSLADNMQAMMDNVGRYTQEIGIIFDDLESMSNAQMQTADNRTAKEKNNLELSQAYREADSEQQQQMMYELDLANYESKKRAFEANKKFQMGVVVTQSAANQIDIIKAWLDPKTGGPLSPANIAIAAAATATNIATTVASLRQISSTSLDKPVPPSSSSGGGSGSSNIALNPHKTSLTSKEENLNNMYKSSMGESENTIVKVSEINNVQKRVQVREKNSSY